MIWLPRVTLSPRCLRLTCGSRSPTVLHEVKEPMSQPNTVQTASEPQEPRNRDASTGQAGDSLNTKDMRRVLGSSLMGSIIEYYDFILYATAASLIFDKVFFSGLNPAVALFASFGTLAVGYIARPLGGIIFGHFGDSMGRKKMLVLSMLMMGGATVAIGLMPTTAAIGVA